VLFLSERRSAGKDGLTDFPGLMVKAGAPGTPMLLSGPANCECGQLMKDNRCLDECVRLRPGTHCLKDRDFWL
jgi:hypothetical protein